jgi:hypothetical protein
MDSFSEESLVDTLNLQMKHWKMILIFEGLLSLFSSLIYLTLSINSFSLSKKLEYYHMSNQFMNLIQVVFSCAILILVRITWTYSSFYLLDESMRDWPVNGVNACACIILISTFVSFYSINKDNINLMRAIGSLQIIIFFLMFLFACFIQYDINHYAKNFNCYEAMSIVHQSDYGVFNCKMKYMFNSANIT